MKCSQSEQKYDDAYFSKLEKDYEHLKGAPMPCCYSEDELMDMLRNYYAMKLDKELERLWDEGILNQEKLDEIDLHTCFQGDWGKDKSTEEYCDELRRDLLPTKEIDKFNETTLEAIEEARTEEAAGTIDTSSYDAFVNSISKKCGLDEALDDVKAGRVSEYASVDDFFREIKV